MREPAVAGMFYPSDRKSLIAEIETCFNHPLGPKQAPYDGSRKIVAALAPHAGYRASGMNAAHTFAALKADGKPDAYVIIGPDHHGIPYDIALCSEPYLTPLGPCPVHEEIVRRLSEDIVDSPGAHAREHSVEVEVPFIQYIDPEARIVPIVMSDQSLDSAVRLADSIKAACEGFDIVIIASSDLSHYIPKPMAERLDGMVLSRIAAMDVRGMYSAIRENRISVCGYGPIATAMMASSPDNIKILAHTDSWDSLHHDAEAVVGYGSAIMMKSC